MSIYERFSEEELEILRERAERAAKATKGRDAESLRAVLQIRLGDESYGLPIENLVAVYQGVNVVPVPCVPAYVAGIANIRGRIMPVLDLAVLLGAPNGKQTDASSLVVTATDSVSLAFRVETIGDSMTVKTDDLSSLSAEMSSAHTKYLYGILPDGTALANLEAILDDPEIQLN
jgi:purine-binding chemotaxis protein CheW